MVNPLPNEGGNARRELEMGFLEDRVQLELHSGSVHRATGSQEEQHEQEDGRRDEEELNVSCPES